MSDTMTAPAESNSGYDGQDPSDEFDAIGKELGLDEGVEQIGNPEDDPALEEVSDEPEEEKIKLKVNGKTVEKTQKEVIELAQKYSATEMKLETAKKEISEAREMKAKYTSQSDAIKQLLNVMQTGDIDTIFEFVDERLGASQAWNKGVIDYVLKLWEQSKWTPEQKEAAENKKQLSKLKAQQEQQQKAEQDRQYEYQVNQWTEHLNVEVPKALKEIGLPDSEFIRSQVISTWRAAMERGQTPTAMAVANYVKSQLQASNLNFAGNPTSRAQPAQQRPRATAETVKNKVASKSETGYGSWDEWIKNRGR